MALSISNGFLNFSHCPLSPCLRYISSIHLLISLYIHAGIFQFFFGLYPLNTRDDPNEVLWNSGRTPETNIVLYANYNWKMKNIKILKKKAIAVAGLPDGLFFRGSWTAVGQEQEGVEQSSSAAATTSSSKTTDVVLMTLIYPSLCSQS